MKAKQVLLLNGKNISAGLIVAVDKSQWNPDPSKEQTCSEKKDQIKHVRCQINRNEMKQDRKNRSTHLHRPTKTRAVLV